ncbi:MAG: NAD(P)-dependent oxidoreductase [Pseudomonadota bacterium]
MHVLVTGAGGFSGAAVTLGLLAGGHQVTGVVRSGRGRLPERAGQVGDLTVITGDLATDLGLPAKIDAIVHAAGSSPGPGVTAADLFRDNVTATERLVRHARAAGVRKFVLFSSLSVYGRIVAPMVDEATPGRDPDTYGRSKREAEERVAVNENSFCSLALRLPGIIGRGSVRNWLTNVLASARAGREIVVVNPETPFNNAVHVTDLMRLVTRLIEQEWKGSDAVTLGAAGEITAGEAVRLLADTFGGRSRIRQEVSPNRGFVVSSARARERYGYEPMEISAMLRQFAAENADR